MVQLRACTHEDDDAKDGISVLLRAHSNFFLSNAWALIRVPHVPSLQHPHHSTEGDDVADEGACALLTVVDGELRSVTPRVVKKGPLMSVYFGTPGRFRFAQRHLMTLSYWRPKCDTSGHRVVFKTINDVDNSFGCCELEERKQCSTYPTRVWEIDSDFIPPLRGNVC